MTTEEIFRLCSHLFLWGATVLNLMSCYYFRKKAKENDYLSSQLAAIINELDEMRNKE